MSLSIFAMIRIDDSRVDRPPAVVTQDDTYIHKGNGVAYPRLEAPPLARGSEVEVLASRNGWLKVELTSGVTGWIPEQSAVY
jgi:uncharacterized protein YgiM (DUF1202 family)